MKNQRDATGAPDVRGDRSKDDTAKDQKWPQGEQNIPDRRAEEDAPANEAGPEHDDDLDDDLEVDDDKDDEVEDDEADRP